VRSIRWVVISLLTMNVLVFLALAGLRVCAIWRVDRVEQFIIQRSTSDEFATRNVMLVSARPMLGIEVSHFQTTHAADVQRFSAAYARQAKWLWSHEPHSPHTFKGWTLATPVPGFHWLTPIGVQFDNAMVPWSSQATRRTMRVGLSWSLLLIATGVLPVLWGFRSWRRIRRRRKRRRTGCCIECGYDLRATTGQCPECGARSGQVIRV
jgi:hypothetical protein